MKPGRLPHRGEDRAKPVAWVAPGRDRFLVNDRLSDLIVLEVPAVSSATGVAEQLSATTAALLVTVCKRPFVGQACPGQNERLWSLGPTADRAVSGR